MAVGGVRHILIQFLSESVILCLIGALIGIILSGIVMIWPTWVGMMISPLSLLSVLSAPLDRYRFAFGLLAAANLQIFRSPAYE